MKISARLLSPLISKRCSFTKCNARAVAAVGPLRNYFMCEKHLHMSAAGLQKLDELHEQANKARPDFLEHVEPEETLRTIEKVGFDNFDPQTNRARDAGKLMHEGRLRDSPSRPHEGKPHDSKSHNSKTKKE